MQRRPRIVVRPPPPPLPPFNSRAFERWHSKRDFTKEKLQEDQLFWRCLTAGAANNATRLLWKECALVSLRCGVDYFEATKPLTHGRVELHRDQPGRPPLEDFNPREQRPFIDIFFRCRPHTGPENAREHGMGRLRRGDLVVLRRDWERADVATVRTGVFPQARVVSHVNGEIHLRSFVCSAFGFWDPREVRERYADVKVKIQCMVDTKIDMYEVFTFTPYLSMLKALQNLNDHALDLLTPPNAFQIDPAEEADIRLLAGVFREQPFNGFVLNESQAEVVARICLHSKRWPLLVQGPVKTGKTVVLVKAALSLLRNGDVTLITTSTNKAADRIARELLHSSREIDRPSILRFYAPSTDFFTRDVELDEISNVSSESKDFGSLPPFGHKKLVICTMDSAAHFLSKKWLFDRILLPEAPMAKPGEVPLVLSLATERTKVVLFGDQKLLGPHQLPLYISEIEQNYRSFFMWFVEMRAYRNTLQMRPMLDVCYRIHPVLVQVLSTLFYDGRLRSGLLGADVPPIFWSKLPNPEFPIVFIDVDGKEYEDKHSSWSNWEEVRAVTRVIRDLRFNRILSKQNGKEERLQADEVGVISPYKHHSQRIDDALKRMGVEDSEIPVNSVERFLGLTKKAITFTTARTDELGFLKNARRLNAAMSRATDLLIIIGHGRALYECDAYRRLLNICMANGAVVRWDPVRWDFGEPIGTLEQLDAAHPGFAEVLQQRREERRRRRR